MDTDGDGVGDRCYVTPVRSQYPFGTCWGFAATAAAETSILGSVLEDDPDAWKTLDLSEKQLIYFTHTWLDDPYSPQYGEGMHNEVVEASADIFAGGTTFLATNSYAAGIGPVYESRGPEFEYRGREGTIDSDTTPDGTVYQFYSPDDDWTMEESSRWRQDFVLKEAYLLPEPVIRTVDLETRTTEHTYNEAATAAIKEQLLAKRAVMIGFAADVSKPWEGNEGVYMNADTWAHYTWRDESANHAVTIVGWDDAYPAENFLAEHRPPADGAWLFRNSWGAGTNAFPNTGKGNWGIPEALRDGNGEVVRDGNGDPVMAASGYFWLSYYDLSICNPEAFVFDTALNAPQLGILENERILRDQHDLLPVTGLQTNYLDRVVRSANIFTAGRRQMLVYITYQVADPDVAASWKVYKLAPGHTDPEDGILIASGEETHRYGGCYLEGIWPPLALEEGQSYSIVLTEKKPDGTFAMNIPCGLGKGSPAFALQSDLGAPQYAVAVVNEGESMVYDNGQWLDWTHALDCVDLFGGEMAVQLLQATNTVFDNFAIKGLSLDYPIDLHVGAAGDPQELILEAGGEPLELELDLYVPGFEQYPLSDLHVRWELAGGDPSCAEAQAFDDGARAVLTPVSTGTTWLFVHADGLPGAIIPVEVR